MERMQVRLYQRDFSERIQISPALQVERLTWKALGGPAEAVLTGSLPTQDLTSRAAEWAADTLGVPVTVTNQTGENAWWGYVERVEIQQNGLQLVYDLAEMANRVCVEFWQPEPQLEWTGARTFTAWADDLDSQRIFGVKERFFTLRSMDESEAIQARDALLAQHCRPLPQVRQVAANEKAARLRLVCRGWWQTLQWRMACFNDGYQGLVLPGQTTQNLGRGAATDDRIAQSFQTTYGGWCCGEVVVNIKSVGSNTDQVICELCADASGVPGTTLASAAVDASVVSKLRWWVKFLFGTRPSILANTPYWLVFSRSGALSTANFYQLYTDAANSYLPGKLMFWNGSAWLDAGSGSTDINFYTTGFISRLSRMQQLAAVDRGGQFLTGLQVNSPVSGDTLLWRQGRQDCQSELADLLVQGDSSGSPLQAVVEADRRLAIHSQPAENDWQFTLDNQGTLRTRSGREVCSHDLPAGQRVHLANGWLETYPLIEAAAWSPQDGLRVSW